MTTIADAPKSEVAVLPEQVELVSTGLRINGPLSLAEWESVGVGLGKLAGNLGWAIGDWLYYGEWEHGRKYEEGVEILGLAYQTLADYVYVVGKFDISRRRENLTPAHHREVAALPQGDQDMWLDAAESRVWNVKELRAALQADKQQAAETRTKPLAATHRSSAPAVVRLMIDVERETAWQTEAALRDMTIPEWLIHLADEAAGYVDPPA